MAQISTPVPRNPPDAHGADCLRFALGTSRQGPIYWLGVELPAQILGGRLGLRPSPGRGVGSCDGGRPAAVPVDSEQASKAPSPRRAKLTHSPGIDLECPQVA